MIGSTDIRSDLLAVAARLYPSDGNIQRSYLISESQECGYVGLFFFGAGFAAAVDSNCSRKRLLLTPQACSSLGGYLIGGSSCYTIPFVLANTYGLTAAAVKHLHQSPTYLNSMTP